ncbi:MAG: zinc ribbon domain-containing protein [Lactococcus lactis]|uniref:zinc ribbon domain-containing protein n=1 Tax=Lactococcus lactis TaxID=1358 RepID=UPI00264F9C00|nr:zinc ribbon domain-containing protein [Lactococcus lactis]MDN6821861.1 zinc ribbon domain-containing protein [Lactococcus lactis]MDR7697036.1 zinc ribbon domain-containing protein [Lactococcus lactis]
MKCGNHNFEEDQLQATGGNFSKIFDVQNKKFITISCSQCGYTELYKAQTSTGMNILDFLLNG